MILASPRTNLMRPSSRRFLPVPVSGSVIVLACLLGAAATSCKKKDTPTYTDNMVGALRESKAMDARGDMQSLAIAITQWQSNDGSLADTPDFPALVSALQPTWLRMVPQTDPWGAPYAFRNDGSSWELRSLGVDGIAGNADDIVMEDGQVTQLPKTFNPLGQN